MEFSFNMYAMYVRKYCDGEKNMARDLYACTRVYVPLIRTSGSWNAVCLSACTSMCTSLAPERSDGFDI
jgi:hypothetical protein